MGAALGDTLFASLTAFGFTALVQLIVGYSNVLQLAGGLLLLFFGIRTFYMPPPPSFDERLAMAENGGSANSHHPPTRGMASTFVLAVTNPVTLFGFTAFFATLGGFAGGNTSYFAAAFVVLGVFAGSTLWWLTLTTVVGLLHARISDRNVRLINEISGAVVALFGVVVLAHLLARVLG